MAPTARISSQVYLIERGSGPDELKAKRVGLTKELSPGYASVSQAVVKGRTYLFAYARSSETLDVYEFLSASPWLAKLETRPKVGQGHDIVEPFVIGNRPHLMCYSAKAGTFKLFAIEDDLSFSKPFQFYRAREPGITLGFTTVKPMEIFGQVTFLVYGGENGQVALYTLSVMARSNDETPPFRMNRVWSHQWSKGWTRFAFFQFGGETFFLKTNTVKPNVNIDHVLDDLSGASQVGTRLDLKDAQRLSIVQPFKLENGAPCFLTYEKGGEVTLNRFNGDCLGWTTESAFISKAGATHAIPIAIDNKMLILIS